MRRTLTRLVLTVVFTAAALGGAGQNARGAAGDPKATEAYGILALRRVEARSELRRLLGTHTDRHPAVGLKRYEVEVLGREMRRVAETGGARVPKLTAAFGRMVTRKVTLEVELKGLSGLLTPRHPDIKAKEAEIAFLEREIEEILK